MIIERIVFNSFAKRVVALITPVLLFLYLLSLKTMSWRYTIDQQIGSTLYIFLLICFLTLFTVQNRQKMYEFRGFLAIVLVLCLLFLKILFVNAIIVGYILYLFLDLKSDLHEQKPNNLKEKLCFLANHYSGPMVFALLAIVFIPLFQILKLENQAEQLAILVFWLILIGIFGEVRNIKNPKKSNGDIFEFFQFSFLDKKMDLGFIFKTIKFIKSKFSFNFIEFFKTLISKLNFKIVSQIVVSILVLISVLFVQRLYWKKLLKNLEQSKNFTAKIELVRNQDNILLFSPSTNILSLDLKITHLNSNPIIWSNTGNDAVRIKVSWFPLEGDGNILHEEIFKIDNTVPINKTIIKRINIQRPKVIPWGTFGLSVGMVYGPERNLKPFNSEVLKLKVNLDVYDRFKFNNLENVNEGLLMLLNDQLGLYLMNYPFEFKPDFKLINKTETIKGTYILVSLTNNGESVWPYTGDFATNLSVCWMRKKKDKNEILGFDTIFLEQNLNPKKTHLIKIHYNPYKFDKVEKIFLSLNRSGVKPCEGNNQIILNSNMIETKQIEKSNSLMKVEDINIPKKKYSELMYKIDSILKKNSLISEINNSSISDQNKYKSEILLRSINSKNEISVKSNEGFYLNFKIRNRSLVNWPTGFPNSVKVGLLWFDKDKKRVYEDRCILPSVLAQGKEVDMTCKFRSDVYAGKYEVWLSLVHESVTWFYEKGDAPVKLNITVF